MAKLLVVIGALEDEDHVKHVIRAVSAGIDHWLRPFPLHAQEEIRLILNSLPSMKSIPNRNADNGSVVSRFKGRILDTTILINPTLESLHYEFTDLLSTASPDCLLVYGGFVSEGEADWILQDGLFALDHLLHIFRDSKILSSISDKKIKVAISCHKIGRWRNIEMNDTNENIHLEIIDSSIKEQDNEGKPAKSIPEENNLDSFTSFLEESIANEIDTVFNNLKPPRKEGFIKTRNPCLYIFPGGYGDSAYFAINGFNMLVNGGSTSKPCFWKLVQHIDRVDSILATHLGADNLPGINSFLMRKLQEQQIKLPIDSTSEEYQELRRCLISPQLGPMFINAPVQYLESLPKSSPRKGITEVEELAVPKGPNDQLFMKPANVIKDTIRLSKALNLKMTPLCRKSGSHEPITLFSKFGCGKLDMYVLNPTEGSKELNFMNEKWGMIGHCKIPVGFNGVPDEFGHDGTASYADLCSISVLLVWHPSDPNEKIVRVLFPGNASQSKIFDGLDGISELPFMKLQHATASSVRAMKEASKVNGASSSQKTPRPASGAAKSVGSVQKKFAPTIGKKAAGSSNSLTKEAVSSHSKISDKRAKNEKPTATKSKTSTSATSKAATLKDRSSATKATKGIGSQVSARANSASSTTKRPQTVPSSKSDMKRPAPSKTAAARAKPMEKTSEKSKKPAVQKTKADSARLTAKKSPRQLTKKSTSSKPTSEKGAKMTKDVPQPQPPSHQAVTPVAVSPTSAKPDLLPSTVESQDVGMEEPNETMLSERRSPDGGDGSSVQCAFGVVHCGVLEALPTADGEVKSAGDCGNLHFVNKPCISEESDMISTDGSSALSMQPTPVRDAISMPEVAKFEEYISSDKSTPDEQQGVGENDGEILPGTLMSDKESSEKAVELINQPTVHGHEASDIETANGCGIEDAAISSNVMTIDTTATTTLRDDDNSPNGTVEQKECQSEEPTGDIEVNNQLVDCSGSQLAQVTGSEILSSSVDGSHELCPTGKSPIPASTQETIAETISEFKLDEPVAATEEDPTIDLHSQLHQTDVADISIEAFDTHGDISSGLTASVVARIDPPFSSSDASHSTKDPAPEQELAPDVAEVQSDANRYENDVEESKEPVDFAMTDHSEDPFDVPKEAEVSNTEEDHDNLLIGDRESHIPAVVDSVPWNESEWQHQDDNWHQSDPVETTHDTMRFDTSDVEVGKIISLSEKELLHQDEKDSVSVHESFENSDVDDAGNVSENERHPEVGEEADYVPEAFEHSGVDDAGNATEKKFPDQNENESVSVPETFEYSDDDNGGESSEEEVVHQCENGFVPAPTELSEDDAKKLLEKESIQEDNEGANYPQQITENSDVKEENDRLEETNNQGGHPGNTEDEVANQGSQLPSADCTVDDKFELHASQACGTDVDVANIGSDRERDDHIDEGEAGMTQSTSSCCEASQPKTDNDASDEEYDFKEGAELCALLSEDNPMEAKVIATVRELDQALRRAKELEVAKKAEANKAESVENDEILGYNSSLPEITEEFTSLHGGDNAELMEARDASQKTANEDHINQPLVSDEQVPVDESSVDQQNVCPISIITDTKELDIDVDQAEARKFDSPLNAAAVPFIPSTMQSDQLKPDDELGYEDGVAAYATHGAAAAVPPASTNPFLLDMLADSPSTLVEPEELFIPPTRDQDPCAGQDKFGKATAKKSTQARKQASSHVYVDLAYIPNHGDKASVGSEFFKKIRARYYVISGSKMSRDLPSMDVLNYLLQGRKLWLSEPGANAGQEDSNVTVIPTHDTPSLKEWYDDNFKELKKYNIYLIASGSKVMMQEESIEACKIEF